MIRLTQILSAVALVVSTVTVYAAPPTTLLGRIETNRLRGRLHTVIELYRDSSDLNLERTHFHTGNNPGVSLLGFPVFIATPRGALIDLSKVADRVQSSVGDLSSDEKIFLVMEDAIYVSNGRLPLQKIEIPSAPFDHNSEFKVFDDHRGSYIAASSSIGGHTQTMIFFFDKFGSVYHSESNFPVSTIKSLKAVEGDLEINGLTAPMDEFGIQREGVDLPAAPKKTKLIPPPPKTEVATNKAPGFMTIKPIVDRLSEQAIAKVDTYFSENKDERLNIMDYIEKHFDVVKDVIVDDLDYKLYEKEIDLATTGLLMQQGGSIRVTGSPGVGKSHFESVLLGAIFGKLDSKDLENRLYIRVSRSSLEGGASYVGQFEERVRALRELAGAVPVVLLIDEVHSLTGAGTHSQNSVDFFQMIKDELAKGSIKIIGATTDYEWEHYFAKDRALSERFSINIKLNEPGSDRLLTILKAFKQKRYADNPVVITDEQFKEIAKLASSFDPIGANPRKSIRLLDYVLAQAKKTKATSLEANQIVKDASALYQYDIGTLAPEKIKDRILHLNESLNKNLAGLERAKGEIALAAADYFLRQNSMTAAQPSTVLLYGDAGAGKTQLAKRTAEALGFNFKRFMMSNYATAESAEDFKTELALAIQINPHTVALVDELEKAHPAVQAVFLRVLDEGRLNAKLSRDARNEAEIDMSKVFFIGATNAGGILANFTHTASMFAERAEAEGLNRYLLDRFAAFIPVPQASTTTAIQIIKMKIRDLEAEYSKSGFSVHIDADRLTMFLMSRVLNKTPQSEPREPIGFDVGHDQVRETAPLAVSTRDLERELGLIRRAISFQIIESNSKSISVDLDAGGNLKIEASKKVVGLSGKISARQSTPSSNIAPVLKTQVRYNAQICRELFR